MSKDKKSGFFSWFKRKEQPQASVEPQEHSATTDETAVTPSTPETQAIEYQDENTPASKDTESPITAPNESESRPAESVNLPHTKAPKTTDHFAADDFAKDVEEPLSPAIEEWIEPAASEAVVVEAEMEIAPSPAIIEHNTSSQQETSVEIEIEHEETLVESETQPSSLTENADIAMQESQESDEEASHQAPSDATPIAPVADEKPEKKGFFSRLKQGLFKTKQNFGSGFFGLFKGKKIDDDLFEELEEQLLIADVGVNTTTQIINSLTEQASRQQLKDSQALYGLLKNKMHDILKKVDQPLQVTEHKPFIILMVGVNGVGKTTTIGKLARQFQQEGKSVMLAAGDTFRAAAVEQLQVWGERNNIPVIAQSTGSDAASVIFDAMQSAKARKIDVLIADTAGRLQNKSHLMDELSKIVRVMKKFDESAPHEMMITLDAGTGQNAISQVKLFNDAVGLTGIVLTKLDGTAKGGVIFGLADQFAIPIRYIGVGEKIDDLRTFNADDFINALFEQEEDK